MNNSNLQKNLLRAARGGFKGFLILIVAGLVFLGVLLSHLFGGSLSLWENIIVLGLVPIVIAFGASIPARALGANLKRCCLAGISAMLVFVFIDISGGQINYGPFSNYETAAFIIAILITVLIATTERNRLQSNGLATLIILSTMLIGLKFMLPEELLIGLMISLLAWIILPSMAVFFMRPEKYLQM